MAGEVHLFKQRVLVLYIKLAQGRLDQLGVEQRVKWVGPSQRATDKRRHFISVVGLLLSVCGGLSLMLSFYLGPLLFGCSRGGMAMSQTYRVGPVTKAVRGNYGGGIATWLCMGFSGVIYPPLRYWELKKFGR